MIPKRNSYNGQSADIPSESSRSGRKRFFTSFVRRSRRITPHSCLAEVIVVSVDKKRTIITNKSFWSIRNIVNMISFGMSMDMTKAFILKMCSNFRGGNDTLSLPNKKLFV